MKTQLLLLAFLAGVILVSCEEKKSDAKPAEADNKKTKRGLFDLGDDHGFDALSHGQGISLDSHQHEHITHSFKEIKVPFPAPYPVHIEKKVPVPYPVKVPVHVPNPVPYPVEKPYPVPVEKPVPYPVEKRIPVPVKVPVKVPYPVHVPYPVEKPYPVPVVKKVHVPVKKPFIVEKEVPYIVKDHGHDFGGFGHGLDSHHF